MRLKGVIGRATRSLPLQFAFVSTLIVIPGAAIANDGVAIEYVPLGGPSVVAADGWQWHPPLTLPGVSVSVQPPVSWQVDQPSTEELGERAESGPTQQPYMYPLPGPHFPELAPPSDWED